MKWEDSGKKCIASFSRFSCYLYLKVNPPQCKIDLKLHAIGHLCLTILLYPMLLRQAKKKIRKRKDIFTYTSEP